MPEKRIYVAGPMTGYYLFNFPMFDRAQQALLDRGWDVISPAELDREEGFDPTTMPGESALPYENCMARDKDAIETCTDMAFLPGWQPSGGANREKKWAVDLGLKLWRIYWAIDGFNMEPMVDEGIRLSDGKPRVELVPPSASLAIAEVLGRSAQPIGKYAPRNWESGMKFSDCYGPAYRHLVLEWWEGKDTDKESGLPHLWHALTNIAFLVEYLRTGKGTDDRPGK